MATPQPHVGIPIKQPQVGPLPGQVIVGYQIVEPETGCCKCDNLTGGGLALLILGILFFFPIAIIPCFMADFKKKTQVPVYGYPGAGPHGLQTAQPTYGAPPPHPPAYPATAAGYPAPGGLAKP